MAFYTADPHLQVIEQRNRQLRANAFAVVFRSLAKALIPLVSRMRGAGARRETGREAGPGADRTHLAAPTARSEFRARDVKIL